MRGSAWFTGAGSRVSAMPPDPTWFSPVLSRRKQQQTKIQIAPYSRGRGNKSRSREHQHRARRRWCKHPAVQGRKDDWRAYTHTYDWEKKVMEREAWVPWSSPVRRCVLLCFVRSTEKAIFCYASRSEQQQRVLLEVGRLVIAKLSVSSIRLIYLSIPQAYMGGWAFAVAKTRTYTTANTQDTTQPRSPFTFIPQSTYALGARNRSEMVLNSGFSQTAPSTTPIFASKVFILSLT